METRRCPVCAVVLPIGEGVEFDEKNNVICTSCKNPIIATNSQDELKIKVKNPPPVATAPFIHIPGYVGCSEYMRVPVPESKTTHRHHYNEDYDNDITGMD